jgi:hypothetical protein
LANFPGQGVLPAPVSDDEDSQTRTGGDQSPALLSVLAMNPVMCWTTFVFLLHFGHFGLDLSRSAMVMVTVNSFLQSLQ